MEGVDSKKSFWKSHVGRSIDLLLRRLEPPTYFQQPEQIPIAPQNVIHVFFCLEISITLLVFALFLWYFSTQTFPVTVVSNHLLSGYSCEVLNPKIGVVYFSPTTSENGQFARPVADYNCVNLLQKIHRVCDEEIRIDHISVYEYSLIPQISTVVNYNASVTFSLSPFSFGADFKATYGESNAFIRPSPPTSLGKWDRIALRNQYFTVQTSINPPVSLFSYFHILDDLSQILYYCTDQIQLTTLLFCPKLIGVNLRGGPDVTRNLTALGNRLQAVLPDIFQSSVVPNPQYSVILLDVRADVLFGFVLGKSNWGEKPKLFRYSFSQGLSSLEFWDGPTFSPRPQSSQLSDTFAPLSFGKDNATGLVYVLFKYGHSDSNGYFLTILDVVRKSGKFVLVSLPENYIPGPNAFSRYQIYYNLPYTSTYASADSCLGDHVQLVVVNGMVYTNCIYDVGYNFVKINSSTGKSTHIPQIPTTFFLSPFVPVPGTSEFLFINGSSVCFWDRVSEEIISCSEGGSSVFGIGIPMLAYSWGICNGKPMSALVGVTSSLDFSVYCQEGNGYYYQSPNIFLDSIPSSCLFYSKNNLLQCPALQVQMNEHVTKTCSDSIHKICKYAFSENPPFSCSSNLPPSPLQVFASSVSNTIFCWGILSWLIPLIIGKLHKSKTVVSEDVHVVSFAPSTS